MAKTQGLNDYVPEDYEDLYRYYIIGDGGGNSLCHQLIRKILPYSDTDERETLAHDVFLRLLKQKMLERYDPSKSNFGGVIFFTTRTVCTTHLAKKSRNPLTGLKGGTLVSTVAEEGEFEPGTYNLDNLFQTETPDYENQIYNKILLKTLFDWAKEKYENPRHKRDEGLLGLLFLLADQKDAKECGKVLKVTPSTIYNWISVIRDKALELKAELA